MKKGSKSKSSKLGRSGVKRTKKRDSSHKISRTIRKLQTPKRERKIITKLSPVKKEIIVRRSSGRVEKFDTNRLAQTVSRSGVPFLMARDIAKKATKKIKSQIMSPVREDNHMNKKTEKRTVSRGRKSSPKPEPVVVTASQVRNLVVNELQDRNRPEIASSYTGYSP